MLNAPGGNISTQQGKTKREKENTRLGLCSSCMIKSVHSTERLYFTKRLGKKKKIQLDIKI